MCWILEARLFIWLYSPGGTFCWSTCPIEEKFSTRHLREFNMGAMSLPSDEIPQTQTVALVRELGGSVEFREGYPVPTPGSNEDRKSVV